MVTHVVPLADMPAAFEALRTPSQQCKVLTRIAS
jgi:threonine dehydrogenase-like Zn-dependent dehydrogenase